MKAAVEIPEGSTHARRDAHDGPDRRYDPGVGAALSGDRSAAVGRQHTPLHRRRHPAPSALREATVRGHSIKAVADLSEDQLRDLVEQDQDLPTTVGGHRSGLPDRPSFRSHPRRILRRNPTLRRRRGRESHVPGGDVSALAGPDLSRPPSDHAGHRRVVGARRVQRRPGAPRLDAASRGARAASCDPIARARARKIIATTPEGHYHEFGVLIGALLAADRGLDPVYLGPNLPEKDVLAAVEPDARGPRPARNRPRPGTGRAPGALCDPRSPVGTGWRPGSACRALTPPGERSRACVTSTGSRIWRSPSPNSPPEHPTVARGPDSIDEDQEDQRKRVLANRSPSAPIRGIGGSKGAPRSPPADRSRGPGLRLRQRAGPVGPPRGGEPGHRLPPGKTTLRHAQKFDVEDRGDYRIVNVRFPLGSEEARYQYALLPRGLPVPDSVGDIPVIRVPVERAVSFSTTHLTPLTSSTSSTGSPASRTSTTCATASQTRACAS